ncbi:hypothetical protein SISSUDRAFT_987932 [Sistotremastrum suecicum HHB10207 ss-3]|uniref:ERCC4 domain-containing protein n=1 Tax=Sistotremastrum suecicum HHB10207 ss-3 TaxID=1314776 RepID=A0A166CCW0_9AGAM|nr:hypothetical protein SISSUDRAFT_987932 [Sistotremastrum suecicum HHB10207 ss-3]
MSTLLGFQKKILSEIVNPDSSDLVLLARGLGLRKIICSLMQIYDSPHSLILLVNANADEEGGIGEELGIMGVVKPGLRIVGHEMPKKDRQVLYKKGGLISITSRILVVDMLQSDIPTDMITGILVLHAEKVTALSLEAFIVRLYRERNEKGFLKAFSDQPEHITSGLSPLKAIMKELQVRKVHIYPRFHQDVQESLERRKADVVELHQPMSEAMTEIHHSIVQCMTMTLAELKRSHKMLDLDDLSVENAYFRSFDVIVRKQLDPVWHKVAPKTKQLVGDLTTLRQLLTYLLTYDSIDFHAYLETIIAANTTNEKGVAKVHQSPWLMTDASNVIFSVAKRRCYISTPKGKRREEAIDIDQDEWDALNEAEGWTENPAHKQKKKKWMPDNIDPVLEELPKWDLVAEVLQEIEQEIIQRPLVIGTPGSNTVLIMTSSNHSANSIRQYLSSMDYNKPSGSRGRKMMEGKLWKYLFWKGSLSKRAEKDKAAAAKGDKNTFEKADDGISEALRMKDRQRQEKSAARRRVRGGPPVGSSAAPTRLDKAQQAAVPETMDILIKEEADDLAHFFSSRQAIVPTTGGSSKAPEVIDLEQMPAHDDFSSILDSDYDIHYGLIPQAETVLVRAYSDDSDDQILSEIRPRFIVMFEPNPDFIRRIEVYRSSNPGLGVRVYFMVYHLSSEEHRYLAALRKEKESFERLIKERANMMMVLEERRSNRADTIIKTISTRIGGGGTRTLNNSPSQVIVDMREFGSTLPSIIHASNLLVIPATLTVGDYILTPDICVERKSLPDLIASFNSGRLYTQCELMSVHYKHPVLLIEFEEHKSFSLEMADHLKNYVKNTGKFPTRKGATAGEVDSTRNVQSKLVLLVLSFPRLRIIWSSSPYASAEIFNELKLHNPEPNPSKAISIGAEEDNEAGAGINQTAEELLRTFPGITAKNVRYVMSKVKNIRELCELDLKDVQEILGVDPGKSCWEFLHQGGGGQK